MTSTTPGLLRIERLPITHPDAARLVAEVQAEYVVRYGGPDETPLDPDEFDPGRGAFFVGYRDAEPVATGAWRWHEPPAGLPEPCAEVKRMYVAAGHRQLGLGRVMLRRLEDDARDHGAVSMIMETGLAQPEAIAMYSGSGYALIENFGYYCGEESSRCFGRLLG